MGVEIGAWLALLAVAVAFFLWAAGWFAYDFVTDSALADWWRASVRAEWPDGRRPVVTW